MAPMFIGISQKFTDEGSDELCYFSRNLNFANSLQNAMQNCKCWLPFFESLFKNHQNVHQQFITSSLFGINLMPSQPPSVPIIVTLAPAAASADAASTPRKPVPKTTTRFSLCWHQLQSSPVHQNRTKTVKLSTSESLFSAVSKQILATKAHFAAIVKFLHTRGRSLFVKKKLEKLVLKNFKC